MSGSLAACVCLPAAAMSAEAVPMEKSRAAETRCFMPPTIGQRTPGSYRERLNDLKSEKVK